MSYGRMNGWDDMTGMTYSDTIYFDYDNTTRFDYYANRWYDGNYYYEMTTNNMILGYYVGLGYDDIPNISFDEVFV